MCQLLRTFLPLLLLLGPALRAYELTGFTPDQIVPYKQTVNSSGGAVTLNLEVFTPEGHQASDSRPAIVFFFGGGWVSGSPSQFHSHCEYLASRGMVAVSAEYRVRDLHGTSPQECVKDGKSAIRYLRENAAALGIDPNRIVAGGGSAGGHVAAATGTLSSYQEVGEDLSISSRPNALVLFNPVYDKGPYLGFNATVFAMDAFLVSLGYLDEPHAAPKPVTDWVSIFGDASFASGNQATSSPVTTDADADAIAANIPAATLNEGDFIRLTGSVSLNAPLSGQNFRIGFFDGDDPVTAGDGSGYVGIWAGAPDTVDASIAVGDGTGSDHPFEASASSILGPIAAADATVPASTEVSFTLMLSRKGNALDITARFTDGSDYDQEQNLLNQTLSDDSQNAVAFLMSENLDATQASFSAVQVTRGRTLLDDAPPPPPPVTEFGSITYVDAVEGSEGNTFTTGGTASDTS